MKDDSQTRYLCGLLRKSGLIAPVLDNWQRISLPDAWLVAGAIAQTVWNGRHNRPAAHGIADIDIVYFDPHDLSEATEAWHAARLRAAFPSVNVRLDVKNEARVHLWYEAKFAKPLAPYRSIPDAISTFPTTATAVGVRPLEHDHEICAPYGLEDLLGGIVRANKKQIGREVYEAKLARWSALWPNLTYVAWN